MILRARHVLAAGNRLIDNGAVRIADGRIAECGPASSIGGNTGTDLGDGLLLPGFVNAHTHLELSHLAGRLPPRGDFLDWVGRLVEAMRADGDNRDTVREAVDRGRAASLAAGVTAVGDISRLPELTRPVLASGPLRVLSFGEVIAIGRLRDRLASRLDAAANDQWRSEFLDVGISPHAPYTLEPAGLRACAARAVAGGLRMCIHLAETADEAEFTTRLTGPVRTYLERCRVWDQHVPCPGMSPVDYAAATAVLGPDALLAHVNYVTDADLDRVAASGAHVVYCPQTHHAFNHPPHRFADTLERGINVCVGTDSLASNPSLSVLDELRFLKSRRPDVANGLLVEMGTIRAARALGLDTSLGDIAPGKHADLTFVPRGPQGPNDPLENLLRSDAQPTATWVSGQLASPT